MLFFINLFMLVILKSYLIIMLMFCINMIFNEASFIFQFLNNMFFITYQLLYIILQVYIFHILLINETGS